MTTAIRVKNLTKQFGRITAVDAVSFEASSGEIFGLLGPNGAGKTTTIRMLATILSPTAGTAEVGGFDVIKSPERVRQSIGVLTTDIGHYERFTGRENLRYFGRLYGLAGKSLEARIVDLAELLEMSEFLDRRAGQYSTGMKQKLAIARSVIHNPSVVVFDEPTSGLDVLASQTVVRFMQNSASRGACVLFSTHRMSDAERLCQRVAILHHGRLVACDSVAALKSRTGSALLEDAFLNLVAGSQ